jgi:archaellum component FlaF (FlaF/FlaG flagellin family)
MAKHSSTVMFGLLLVIFGFLWLASDQGWIRVSESDSCNWSHVAGDFLDNTSTVPLSSLVKWFESEFIKPNRQL